jgi:hypothetical protein
MLGSTAADTAATVPPPPEHEEGTAPRKPSKAKDDGAWRDFVRQQDATALADRLLAWADRLPELRRDLQQWQRLSAPVAEAGEAKKLVTALLSGATGLWEWRKVAAWVRKAEAVLSVIDAWLASDPGLALAGAEAAYLKLVSVLETADDSHGHVQGLMQSVAERWAQALQAVGERPAAYAERLLRLMAADAWGHLGWPRALAAVGAPARSRLGQQLAQRWMATREEGEGGDGAREAYLSFLEATGDVEEMVRVRRHRLRSAYEHLQLVALLGQHGRTREALQAAEQAHKLHPTDPRLTDALVALYERDGWDDEALALRQAAFARRPSNAAYHALLRSAASAGRDPEAVRATLWQVLHAAYAAASTGRAPMTASEVGSLMLDLWVDEGRADEAMAWLGEHRHASGTAVTRLARTLAPTQPEAALTLYKRVLLTLMPRSTAPYAGELALVREAVAGLPREASRLWLAWLRLEYRHKRRFVEGLVGL